MKNVWANVNVRFAMTFPEAGEDNEDAHVDSVMYWIEEKLNSLAEEKTELKIYPGSISLQDWNEELDEE